MYPTLNSATPNGQGDWFAFDSYATNIVNSLQQLGWSQAQISERMSHMRQFLLGPSGPQGQNLYDLRTYDTNNRDTKTLGQKVALNLGLCHG